MKTGYGLVSFNSTGWTPTTWDYIDWDDGYAEVTLAGANGEQLFLGVLGGVNWDEYEVYGHVTGGIFGETELNVVGDRYEFTKVGGKYAHENMSYFADDLVGTWNLYEYERLGIGVPYDDGISYPFTHDFIVCEDDGELPSMQLIVKENGMATVRGTFLGESVSGTVPVLIGWRDDEVDCYGVEFWEKLENGKECHIWFDLRTYRESGETSIYGSGWLREDCESNISDAQLLQLQFKSEVIGIAVVDDYEVFYDNDALSKVVFLPPQTPGVVPKGKSVLFKLSYDFPDGYGASLWMHGNWPVDDNGSTYSNPSFTYYDNGVAYGFIGIEGLRKVCTIESVSITTGARLMGDDSTTYWRIGIAPVNVTFK